MVQAAVGGDRAAQKLVLSLTADIEAGRRAADAHELDNALEMQRNGYELIEQCKKGGLPPPDLVPHPEDVLIDLIAGKVKILPSDKIAKRRARRVARATA